MYKECDRCGRNMPSDSFSSLCKKCTEYMCIEAKREGWEWTLYPTNFQYATFGVEQFADCISKDFSLNKTDVLQWIDQYRHISDIELYGE